MEGSNYFNPYTEPLYLLEPDKAPHLKTPVKIGVDRPKLAMLFRTNHMPANPSHSRNCHRPPIQIGKAYV